MNIEKLLQEFTTYKVNIEGRNIDSIALYTKHIKEFCADMNIDEYNTFINANAQIIKDWLTILVNKGNGATTRNNKLSAVKQIYLFLEDEKMINVDRRIDRIKYAKVIQKETKCADKIQVEQLLRATNNQRSRAMISVIHSTGVRFKELIQITCTDIENGFAVILGKGNKERTIWFDPSCTKICKDYINGKRARIIKTTGVETDLLFISDRGNLISRQSFDKSLKLYANKTGLYWGNEMSPHKIRHGFVTDSLDDGIPIQIVRDAVGHANIATTNRYAHTNKNAIKDAMLREK